MSTISWVYVGILALMAGFTLVLGVRGLVGRRPIVFSARWLFAFLGLAFSPQAITALRFGFEHPGTSPAQPLMAVFFPVMFVFLLIVFWLQMRGYLVFGVTDGTVRSALHHALQEKGLQFEERLGAIAIPSEGLDVQVAIQSWMGTAQIKAKQSSGRHRVAELSEAMRRYYASNSLEVPKTVFVIYAIIGVCLSITAVVLARA